MVGHISFLVFRSEPRWRQIFCTPAILVSIEFTSRKKRIPSKPVFLKDNEKFFVASQTVIFRGTLSLFQRWRTDSRCLLVETGSSLQTFFSTSLPLSSTRRRELQSYFYQAALALLDHSSSSSCFFLNITPLFAVAYISEVKLQVTIQ